MKAQELLAFLNLAFALVLALRLLKLDLHRLYRLFSAYLLLDLVETLFYLALRLLTTIDIDYRWVWSLIQVGKCSLYIWMAVALLSKVMESIPGVLMLSQRVFSGGLIAGVLLGLANLLWRLNDASNIPPLEIVLAVESAVLIVTFLLLQMVLGFILWFPVELPRNLILFSAGYVVFFGTKLFVFFFARSANEPYLDALSTINIVIATCCLLFWLTTLSAGGEKRRTLVGHQWNSEEQTRLVGQLAAINESLIKTAKRL